MSFPRYAEYKDSAVEWLGEIPVHWRSIPLRFLANGPLDLFIDGDWIESKDIEPGTGIRYITTGNVGEGKYREQGDGFISDETFTNLNCTEVLPGDILISRLNAPIGRACVVPDLGNRIVTSVDNVIFRPAAEFDRRYLVYLLSSHEHFANTELLARGSTMQRISRSILGNIRFCMPLEDEQANIAAFLDRETAKIDVLVAEQEKLVALLKEKRQAVISHAVTKGLNPDAPMKDSGIEWLGEVPAHWEVSRIANLFREIAEPGTDELPILSVSIHHGVSDNEIDEEDMERKVTRSDDRSKYKLVAPGDLVYNMMRAWQGGFGTVTVEGMVSPAYVVARPRRGLETAYIEHLLRTPHAVEQMRRHSRGVTDFRLRLYWDEFKNIRVTLPPQEEARTICEKIAEMEERFGAMSVACEESINLLQERRSALISAAVTGKIDVRGLVARHEAACLP